MVLVSPAGADRGLTALPWHQRPAYPWLRLIVSLLLATVGSAGMYVVVVVLPAVQSEFATARTGASLPYTMTMLGFGAGGIIMGPLTDRLRIFVPLLIGGACLAAGFITASWAGSIVAFDASSFLIGLGCSSSFAPLVADISLWFTRRRGIAVAIVASGNYLAGAIWPPIVQHVVDRSGWRTSYLVVGVVAIGAIAALAWVLRPTAPVLAQLAKFTPPPGVPVAITTALADRPLGLRPNALQRLLFISGISCCVAMSMPQVHIVALCADLGYGTARGAQMLSLMLTCGIASRLTFGWISDHIGGAATLLLGATLQVIALVLFLPNQSLNILFAVSALFGLFQGGIVPSYAMIVRENFRPEQAATRVSWTLTSTLLGMALGGWASGAIFDLTSSYDAAFVHGIAWNLLTIAIAAFLVLRGRRFGRHYARDIMPA